MLPVACLALVLAGSPGSDAADARAELDACAVRIEELKSRREAGQEDERELERLLVRAQELALELQRTRDALPPAVALPSAEELRERADAARDEADRLAAEIAELDVKLGDQRRNLDPAMAGVAFGIAPSQPPPPRLRELQLQRAWLAQRRAAAEAAAARLEAEARAAESVR